MRRGDHGGEGSGMSETGNWNIAEHFSKIHISIPMAKCSYYREIAEFGYESIAEELMGYNIDNSIIKHKGLKRLISELIEICRNVKFALKKKGTKAEIIKLEKQLGKLDKLLPSLLDVKHNHVAKTKEVRLNIKQFEIILGLALQIKSDINTPLNKNHLIFVDKEETDTEEFKRQVRDDYVNRG